MKFESGIRAEFHEVLATDLVMEPLTYLDCSATADTIVSSNQASGGGHASSGGTGSGGDGSEARGSLFEPEDLGAQGGAHGGQAGGMGGNKIKITIGNVFYMDGTLNADGGAGSNLAGGGSGGSIWINAGA